jgi:hypothetical protein
MTINSTKYYKTSYSLSKLDLRALSELLNELTDLDYDSALNLIVN